MLVAVVIFIGPKIATRVQAQPAPIARHDALADLEASGSNVLIQTYRVSGRDVDSIRASMSAAGPVDGHDHQRVDALTRWFINWNWQDDGRGGCDLANATVTFHATVLLPELSGLGTLPPDLARRWRAYRAALETHEAGHVRYAYQHMGDVKRALASSTCAGADAAAHAAVAIIGRHDVAYDRETHHGATQGAVFP
jgi:predicted secreted Zn-dependent protease